MRILLTCTGRGTHDPVPLESYTLPLPPGWRAGGPSQVYELICDRRRGGCGYSPRPGDEMLRTLLAGLAERGETVFDVSYWNI